MKMPILFDHVDSRSELVESLRCSGAAVLLGDEEEATREYFKAATPSCTIGVCSQGDGPRPAGFIDELNAEAWVGYNSKVANLDIRACCIRFVIQLDWVFYSVIDQMSDGSVIVIYELGACRVSRSGETIWSCTTDVVTDFSNDGECIRIQTDDAELKIDKEHGTVLR
jgi:hypothetical protein